MYRPAATFTLCLSTLCLVAAPVRFIENKGQLIDAGKRLLASVLFKAQCRGGDVYLTSTGLTIITSQKGTGSDTASRLVKTDIALEGAIIRPPAIRTPPPLALHHYYLAHCPDGIRNVGVFDTILIPEVYPGIDWLLYGKGQGIEYDFIVRPGGDPSLIRLVYKTVTPVSLSADGSLALLSRGHGGLQQSPPVSFIRETGKKIRSRVRICSTVKMADHYETTLEFVTSKIRRGETLVIDPQLVWLTPMGGSSAETIYSTNADGNNCIFIVGSSQSNDFPLVNAGTYFQGTSSSSPSNQTAYISKFGPGGVLMWSTYYGGSSQQAALSVANDTAGNVIVTGWTTSSNFPLQNNGGYFQSTPGGNDDVFILKFDNNGNRQWATLYGGSALDRGHSVTTDKYSNLYVGGISYSTDFPLMNAGGFFEGNTSSPGNSKGFLMKFSNTGQRLWATGYQGDMINAVSCDTDRNLYITGQTYSLTHVVSPAGSYSQSPGTSGNDAFVAKFDTSLNLVWGSYYGGNNHDYGRSIITGRDGKVFISGFTYSPDLPLTGPDSAYLDDYNHQFSTGPDIFLAAFNNTCSLTWATYIGGSGFEQLSSRDALAMDACDNLYVAFETGSAGVTTLAACEGGYQAGQLGNWDVFLMRFSSGCTLQWASHLGSNGPDQNAVLAVDRRGELFLASHLSPQSPSSLSLVNPGNNAYFQNSINGISDVLISRFSGASATVSPAFSFPIACASSQLTLSPTPGNSFIPGGVFSGPPQLKINPLTGEIITGNLSVGTYPIRYQWQDCQCKSAVYDLNVSLCESVTSDAYESFFEIYPIPSNGLLQIRSSLECVLEIMDSSGRLMDEITLNPANGFVKEIDLPSGIYLVSSGNARRKIVVTR